MIDLSSKFIPIKLKPIKVKVHMYHDSGNLMIMMMRAIAAVAITVIVFVLERWDQTHLYYFITMCYSLLCNSDEKSNMCVYIYIHTYTYTYIHSYYIHIYVCIYVEWFIFCIKVGSIPSEEKMCGTLGSSHALRPISLLTLHPTNIA